MISRQFFGTAITVKATVLVPLGALWAVVTGIGLRRHPNRGWRTSVLVGLGTVLVLVPTEWGHPFAHVFSARLAGAPMDEVLISAGMPRTLYWNNAVSPNTHRLRASGGPIFNALGCIVSALLSRRTPPGSVARELTIWSALGHGALALMSLVPLPAIDGGALLKWTLVARGRSEQEADELIRWVDWGLAILAGSVAAGFIALHLPRLPGRRAWWARSGSKRRPHGREMWRRGGHQVPSVGKRGLSQRTR